MRDARDVGLAVFVVRTGRVEAPDSGSCFVVHEGGVCERGAGRKEDRRDLVVPQGSAPPSTCPPSWAPSGSTWIVKTVCSSSECLDWREPVRAGVEAPSSFSKSAAVLASTGGASSTAVSLMSERVDRRDVARGRAGEGARGVSVASCDGRGEPPLRVGVAERASASFPSLSDARRD